MALEQEIKVPVSSLASIRQALAVVGARLARPRTFEENWVLDDASGTLSGQRRLLRLRRFGDDVILTFKGPPSFAGPVKSRLELETGVSDHDVLLEVLAALGFTPVRRYQKWREVWLLEAVTVVLDETPMGAFVELEGDAARLADLARRLGVDPDAALADSYIELWIAYRESHPGAPADMVFP